MPLQLQKGNETDLDRIYTIQTAAFAEDDLGQILFPGEITEDAKTRAIERARKDMRDPDITYMLAVDTDLDSQIVGFGKWHIYKHERPESEWKKVQKRDWGEGANVAAADEFFGAIQEKRARIIGGAAHCRENVRVLSNSKLAKG
ncbi:hypothetical protein MMC24_005972 [Lignoscripta atroalba]|nr:hypothetical protein [Lignoscripta atroalba]